MAFKMKNGGSAFPYGNSPMKQDKETKPQSQMSQAELDKLAYGESGKPQSVVDSGGKHMMTKEIGKVSKKKKSHILSKVIEAGKHAFIPGYTISKAIPIVGEKIKEIKSKNKDKMYKA